MKRRENIVLVGMPASGKSTIGVILAKVLKYRFVDTDLILQDATDQTLMEIIDQRGLDGFLALEEETVAGLEARRSVIATGGSVIYGERAMENLKRQGVVVYLQHRYEVIAGRLTNIRTRGVAMRPGETLRDLYDNRVPLYERWADLTLAADGLTTEQVVEELQRRLRETGCI